MERTRSQQRGGCSLADSNFTILSNHLLLPEVMPHCAMGMPFVACPMLSTVEIWSRNLPLGLLAHMTTLAEAA